MPNVIIKSYSGSKCLRTAELPFENGVDEFDGCKLKIEACAEEKDGCLNYRLTVTSLAGTAESVSAAIEFCEEWNRDVYAFAPAALYNGNRFHTEECPYPPMIRSSTSPEMPITITDVPRLADGGGKSEVTLSVGDLSVPCTGFFNGENKTGFLLFSRQKSNIDNYGFYIKETDSASRGLIGIMTPAVREEYKYSMCSMKTESDDFGARLSVGESITVVCTVKRFRCDCIADFYNEFFINRKRCVGESSLRNDFPFSAAWRVLEQKYNRSNWVDGKGFYKSSEAQNCIYGQWQTGWVGGAMNTFPCFADGDDVSILHAEKTLDFLFTHLQAKSGFLYGIFYDDKIYGDDFFCTEKCERVMSRKNADALYFVALQLLYLKNAGKTVSALWENGLKKLCGAFVRLYRRYGQFGQIIDVNTEEIYIGSTAAAGIAIAGLAVCSELFDDKTYLETAVSAAERYYDNFTKAGITNGGPGEIMQCPDSESAYGLLEAFMTLYEYTGDKKHLEYAAEAANQFSSWCVAYNYKYDENTQFNELQINTSGAVFANVQNKHAAPGICTSSGKGLFRLFRATGKAEYLDLLKDIAHNCTQYISREDRPLRISYVWSDDDIPGQKRKAKETADFLRQEYLRGRRDGDFLEKYYKSFNRTGRVNERVNLSDWEGKGNVGELPDGSSGWCEVSCMLTSLEIPSVYWQTDTGFITVFDHFEVKQESAFIEVINNTAFDAVCTVFAETAEESQSVLKQDYFAEFKKYNIPSKSKIIIEKGEANE